MPVNGISLRTGLPAPLRPRQTPDTTPFDPAAAHAATVAASQAGKAAGQLQPKPDFNSTFSGSAYGGGGGPMSMPPRPAPDTGSMGSSGWGTSSLIGGNYNQLGGAVSDIARAMQQAGLGGNNQVAYAGGSNQLMPAPVGPNYGGPFQTMPYQIPGGAAGLQQFLGGIPTYQGGSSGWGSNSTSQPATQAYPNSTMGWLSQTMNRPARGFAY